MTIVPYDHPQARGVETQLLALAPRFRQASAGILDDQRLIRSVMIAMDRNRELFNVEPQSILMAAMTAATVGLEPDGLLGQSFLVPFNVKGRGKVAQFMTGYKGYSTLAARGSYIVRGDVVREGDDFEYSIADGIVHHARKAVDAGRIVGAWSRAVSNHLPAIVEFVPIDELMELRARAKSTKGEGGFSPWLDEKIGFPAMCRKTPVRRLSRSLPLGQLPQFGLAARVDEIVDEQGRHAWADPVSGVQFASTVKPGPIVQTEQPPIDVTTERRFPNLPPDLALKAARIESFVSSVGDIAALDHQHAKIPKTLAQIRELSPTDYDYLADIIDKRRVILLESEQSQTTKE